MDSRLFRQTVGQFVTGVTVIATESSGSVHAMTANSFTSLSLEPPLVLLCVGRHTKMGGFVGEAARFSVNILSRDQRDISSYFAGAWEAGRSPFRRGKGYRDLEGARRRWRAPLMRCTKAVITGS